MLALAGYPLGLEFVFLDPAAEACASPLGAHLHADYVDQAALTTFVQQIDVATYEFENVPVLAADFVAARIPLRPAPKALTAGQDRLGEKQLFQQLGIPVPRYAPANSLAELQQAAEHTGLPAVLKTRRMGYDGKGQARLRGAADFDEAWRALGAQALILEAFVPFEREVSCLGVRALDGSVAFYPLVENVHRDGILRTSRPRANDPLQAEAERHLRRLMEHLDYVGVLAFEFFVVDGQLLANEIAPRVHNSGHWTIEGAETSQFENHLRAITGLPLGSTRLRGASLMLNFIGELPPLRHLAAIENLHVHQYGKTPKPLRKVGHATLTAPSTVALDAAIPPLQAALAAYL
ncbi:MAG: 5-(carboxyamino)imidazole ribonucleotide synthase [Nevskia sp.]|nr:5-(carboxyamino)imidazole ribonucleotide synthase [Nevskia sp.]